MKTRALRPFLAIALAVMLAATSLSLAAARGQTRIAGAVVLCSGALYVPGAADAGGDPAGAAHICPDMALSLFSALALAAPDVPRPFVRAERVAPTEPRQPGPKFKPASAARGPPVLA